MIFMKIEISGSPKEIAELALNMQVQQEKRDVSSKLVIGVIMKKFCDDFGLHDEEIDALLKKIIKE